MHLLLILGKTSGPMRYEFDNVASTIFFYNVYGHCCTLPTATSFSVVWGHVFWSYAFKKLSRNSLCEQYFTFMFGLQGAASFREGGHVCELVFMVCSGKVCEFMLIVLWWREAEGVT